MKHVCLDCDATFTVLDEHVCPVCGSEDILDLPDEVDDTDYSGHHEGDFGGICSCDDREE